VNARQRGRLSKGSPWITVLDHGPWFLTCKRCDGHEPNPTPCSFPVLFAHMDSFLLRHSNCPEPE
jgi:hypothetical protein